MQIADCYVVSLYSKLILTFLREAKCKVAPVFKLVECNVVKAFKIVEA
jgi:hypothetical protein